MGLLNAPSTSMADKDIVVMCNDLTKEEMHSKLNRVFKEKGIEKFRTKIGQNVICRVGDPTSMDDLMRVGAHHSDAILVQVTNEDVLQEDSSFGKILNGGTVRAALALRNTCIAYGGEKLRPDLRIVLQMSNPSQYVDAVVFQNDKNQDVIIPLDLSVFLNTLLFKSASKPGLARILLDIFDFHGKSIRRRRASDLVGGDELEPGHCCGLGKNGKQQTFREMQLQYDSATFVGLLRPSVNSPEESKRLGLGLCPSPDILIEPDDLLIFICDSSTPVRYPETEAQFRAYHNEALQVRSSFTPVHHLDAKNKEWKNFLVCGWRAVWQTDPMRLRERILQTFKHCDDGSIMTFFNHVSIEEFEVLMATIGIFPVHVDGDPDDVSSDYKEYKLYVVTNHMIYVQEREEMEQTGEKHLHFHNLSHCYIRHIVGDAAEATALEPLIMKTTIHSTIVMGTQHTIRTDAKTRDTRVLCIFLLLRKLLEKKHQLGYSVYPMHLVGENQQDMTVKLALGPRDHEGLMRRDPDFVNTQAINARVLCQTMAYPLIRNAVAELFSEDERQSSLEIPSADAYIPMEKELTFGLVQHLVQQAEGEQTVCIGFQDCTGKVSVIPHHSEKRKFVNGDKLIVFSRRDTGSVKESLNCCECETCC